MQETKTIQHTESESLSKQKLALFSIQKQLHILDLREMLIIIGFIFAAAALRVPMQVLPSAEPIIFFAVLAGWLFGKKKGLIVGASALIASNFMVMGWQGPWTIYQAIGFGAAGFMGGFLRKKHKYWATLSVMVLATLGYEIIINLTSFTYLPMPLAVMFFGALPFIGIHLVSNVAFSALLPKTAKAIHEKGGFSERKLLREMYSKLRIRRSKQ
ncbi:MAG: DUF6580 family putative transport protein [archaeon]